MCVWGGRCTPVKARGVGYSSSLAALGAQLHTSPPPELGLHIYASRPGILHGCWGSELGNKWQALYRKSHLSRPQVLKALCYFLCVCAHGRIHLCKCPRRPEEGISCHEPDSQAVMSLPKRVLGTGFRTSAGAANVLNLWAELKTPKSFFFFFFFYWVI